MHIPPAFADTDLQALDALIARDPFATLVTVADGLPCATPLPVLYRRDGARIVIEGHWARANPQSQHRGPALLIVHGPHASVSPGWYPDKEAMARCRPGTTPPRTCMASCRSATRKRCWPIWWRGSANATSARSAATGATSASAKPIGASCAASSVSASKPSASN